LIFLLFREKGLSRRDILHDVLLWQVDNLVGQGFEIQADRDATMIASHLLDHFSVLGKALMVAQSMV
jgi:hypothetical protein